MTSSVTREAALKAWGQVWAGNATDLIHQRFRAQDYAGAKAEAERLIAEQEAGTSDADWREAAAINEAYDLLAARAPFLLAHPTRKD